MVPPRACEPSTIRNGAGFRSTLAMIAVAIRVAHRQTVGRVEHLLERARRRPCIRSQSISHLGAAVTEFGASAARLDDGDADPERGDLLGYGFAEAFDAPFGGVVQRVACERHLPAVAGQLNDAPAACFSHMWQNRADQLNASGQVGGHDRVDLLVGEFLGCAEHAVASIADHDVDSAETADGVLHDGPQRRGVAHIEHLDRQPVGMCLHEVGDAVGPADRAHDMVATVE